MEIGDTFKIKKNYFNDDEELSILEKHISPFLSEQNYIKMNSNGVGPTLDEKIIRYINTKISKKLTKSL